MRMEYAIYYFIIVQSCQIMFQGLAMLNTLVVRAEIQKKQAFLQKF